MGKIHQEEGEVYELQASLKLWSRGCYLSDSEDTKAKCHQLICNVLCRGVPGKVTWQSSKILGGRFSRGVFVHQGDAKWLNNLPFLAPSP